MNPHGKTKIAKNVFFLRKGQIFRRQAPSDIDDYPLIVMGSGAGDTPVSPQQGGEMGHAKGAAALPCPSPARAVPRVVRRIASKRKRTERYGCVKNERTQGSTEHGRYASVFRRVRMNATSRCRRRGLGSGRVAPPHPPEQCRREDSKGDEREALSFGPRGQGRRTASPARLHSDG